MEGPLQINIKPFDKVQVLAKDIPTSFKLESKMQRILERAEHDNRITKDQRDFLLKEFQTNLFK